MSKGYRIKQELKRSLSNWAKGKEEEWKVKEKLRRINNENILINNLNLYVDSNESEIDHLLLTEFYGFNIETKNYSGIIEIDDKGKWFHI